MNQTDINNYLAAGLSVDDVAGLMLAEKSRANSMYGVMQQPAQPMQQLTQPMQQPAQPMQQPAQPMQRPAQPMQQPAQPMQQLTQPMQQLTQSMQPAQPIQLAQPMQQPAQQPNDFANQLATLGATMQQSPQLMPPATNAANQPAMTPANSGITPEEATKLFQAWSMGQATQNVELPPSANDVLAKRFNSLYGVDITQQNQNK